MLGAGGGALTSEAVTIRAGSLYLGSVDGHENYRVAERRL